MIIIDAPQRSVLEIIIFLNIADWRELYSSFRIGEDFTFELLDFLRFGECFLGIYWRAQKFIHLAFYKGPSSTSSTWNKLITFYLEKELSKKFERSILTNLWFCLISTMCNNSQILSLLLQTKINCPAPAKIYLCTWTIHILSLRN